MKRYFVLLVLVVAGGLWQKTEAQEVHRYWVTFADKAGSVYTVDNASEYLSPRALERRGRLGIAVDSLDLPVTPAYTTALREAGYRVWCVSKWLNGAVVYTEDSAGVAERLSGMPFVAEVRYYGEGSLTRAVDPTDWYFGESLVVNGYDTLYGPAYYGTSYNNINTLNGTGLHRAGYEGEGVLVGVCDAGFSGVDTLSAFAAMHSEGRLVATRDFVYGGTAVFDVHNHGTRVLSNMACYLPGGYVGTAPKASYILCRTEDVGGESPMEELFWTSAMEYMDSMGVEVVNTSLGYREYDNAEWSYPAAALDGRTSYMTRAAEAAASRGILVVLAAGNEGYAAAPNIGVPADAVSALTVGATDPEGGWASFSSYGPTADGRIKPDVMSPGEMVPVVNPDGTVEVVSGTSFASPILAGLGACLVERYRDLGPAAWCDSLRSWGSLAAHPSQQCGYGTPDFGKALRGRPDAGIVEVKNGALRLWPNPAGGYVEVAVGDAEMCARVEIYDAAGRKVACRRMGRGIDLTGLSGGVYWVRVIAERPYVQKLVKY